MLPGLPIRIRMRYENITEWKHKSTHCHQQCVSVKIRFIFQISFGILNTPFDVCLQRNSKSSVKIVSKFGMKAQERTPKI